MIDEHAFGVDVNFVASPQDMSVNQGNLIDLYSAGGRTVEGEIYPVTAFVEDFWIRWQMPSRQPITLDPEIYQDLGSLAARQQLKEDIYDRGLGFVTLQIVKRANNVDVVLWDFPVFNSNLPSQSISIVDVLTRQDSAQLATGSQLLIKLINNGSGWLVGEDKIEISVSIKESVYVPRDIPEIRQLTNAIGAMATTMSSLIGINQSYLATIDTLVRNQNLALTSLAAAVQLLQTSGINTNNQTQVVPFNAQLRCIHPNNGYWGKYAVATPGSYKLNITKATGLSLGASADSNKIIELGAYQTEPTMTNFREPGNYRWLADLPAIGGTVDIVIPVDRLFFSIKARNPGSNLFDTVFFSIDPQSGFSAKITLQAF